MKRIALTLAVLLGSLVAVGAAQADPYHHHHHHHGYNGYNRSYYGGGYAPRAYPAPYGGGISIGVNPYRSYYGGGYGGYTPNCAPAVPYSAGRGISFYYGY